MSSEANPACYGMPPGNPPAFLPKREYGMRPEHPETISNCKNHIIYIWLHNGRHFWYYPIHEADRNSTGYMWTGENWDLDEFHINQVEIYY